MAQVMKFAPLTDLQLTISQGRRPAKRASSCATNTTTRRSSLQSRVVQLLLVVTDRIMELRMLPLEPVAIKHGEPILRMFCQRIDVLYQLAIHIGTGLQVNQMKSMYSGIKKS